MDNSALVPDMPILTSDTAEELNTEAQTVVADDTKKAELLASGAWDEVVKILDRHIESFRTGKNLTIDSATPLEEIGKKFVIASTIAQICEDIKADVINAANAVVENGRRGN